MCAPYLCLSTTCCAVGIGSFAPPGLGIIGGIAHPRLAPWAIGSFAPPGLSTTFGQILILFCWPPLVDHLLLATSVDHLF